MARFVSISLVAVVLGNMFAFAQKYEPVPMCTFVQEEVPVNEGTAVSSAVSVTMHSYSYVNSNYLTLEVLGVPQPMPFQLINSQGKEMYSGSIRGTQLVETESWPAGTYYFICGNKRETIYISK
jgi:hypothetical protein